MSKNNDVVIIQLDRPRQVKFSYNALKTLVELTGKPLEELDETVHLSNFEFLEQMAYCGLMKDAKNNGETLVPENMEALLDEAPSFQHVLDKLFTAWRIAFGADTAEGNQLQPAK